MLLRDMVGQDHAVAMLLRAVASGRLAHACLFDGPESVGKPPGRHRPQEHGHRVILSDHVAQKHEGATLAKSVGARRGKTIDSRL